MKQLFFGLIISFLTAAVQAAEPEIIMDVYGVKEAIKPRILDLCKDDIETYVKAQVEYKNTSNVKNKERFITLAQASEAHIEQKLKAIDTFRFVKLSLIEYPGITPHYITLDLVREQDKNRIPHAPKRKIKKELKPSRSVTELRSLWLSYVDKHLKDPSKKPNDSLNACPALHCVWGFDKKEMKTVYQPLATGVDKHQKELQDLLKHSSDDTLREDIIFMLGHAKDPQATANLLSRYIKDPNGKIRNNAMRVLTYLISKYPDTTLNLDPIIQALNFPLATDRNKACSILVYASRDPKSHPLILKKGGKSLIKLLKLKQLNNHQQAYLTLLELNPKPFADTDVESWEAWMKQALRELKTHPKTS